MKPFILFVAFLLMIVNLFGQKIYADYAPIVILDQHQFNDKILTIEVVGNCRSGVLRIDSDQEYEDILFGYTNSAKIKLVEDNWYLLTNNQHGDDIVGGFIKITYEDENGEIIQSQTSDLEEHFFVDFVIADSNIMYLEKDSPGTMHEMNLEGEILNTYQIDQDIFQISNITNKILTISEENIQIYDYSLDLVESVSNKQAYISYEVVEDELYVLTQDSLQVFSEDLIELYSISLPDQLFPKDLEILNDSIYILGVENSIEKVFLHHNSEWMSIFSEVNELTEFNKFTNQNPNLIYGSFSLETDLSTSINNGVEVDIRKEYPSSDLLELNMSDIIERKEFFEIHVSGPDTVYSYFYEYDLEFEITNLSNDTLNSVFISTNREHGINCAWAEFKNQYIDLNLAPQHSMVFNKTLKVGTRNFEELCLYAISHNGHVDTEFDNNFACQLLTSIEETINKELNVFYPTISTDKVFFKESIPNKSSLKIYDQFGRDVTSKTFFNNYHIDIRSLNTGIYFFVRASGDQSYVEKIIKI